MVGGDGDGMVWVGDGLGNGMVGGWLGDGMVWVGVAAWVMGWVAG